MLAVTLVTSWFVVVGVALANAPSREEAVAAHRDTGDTGRTRDNRYRGRTAAEWAAGFRQRTRQLQAVRAHVHARWHPTVEYALRLASAVTGVSYWQLRSVSFCESHHYPFAENGRYKGLFQLGWSPFGFSPFDPVANALSAALTVRRDGSWRQWECQP